MPLRRVMTAAALGAVCALVSFTVAEAEAAPTFDINLYLNNRGTVRAGNRSIAPATYLQPDPLQLYYSGFAEASFDADWTTWFTTRLMLNSGEVRSGDPWTVNGRLVLEEAQATGFVRTALLDFHAPETGWWQIAAGRKLWKIGNSFIYDDWGLGALVSFDFELLNGAPWKLDFSWVIPSRDWTNPPIRSPLLTTSLEYKISLFERFNLSFSYFRDGDGELTEIVRQTMVELELNGPRRPRALICILGTEFGALGDFGYASGFLSKTLGPGTLKVTAVVEAGRMLVRGRPSFADGSCDRGAPLQLTSVGVAFDVGYKWSATDRLAITPFVIGESGARAPGDSGGVYTAYIGVLPFITRTNLFFAGGLAETFGSRRITSAGVNGRGVIAPGVEVLYEPVDVFRMRAIVSPLFAWRGIDPPVGGGGHFYGVEIDAMLFYEPFSFLGFAAEGDVLVGGNFYRTGEPVWKVILSTDLQKAWTL